MMSQFFMLLLLYSVSPVYQYRTIHVGANLLLQLPKPTPEPPKMRLNDNRFFYEFSASSLSHENASDESINSASLYQDFSSNIENGLKFYCDFINDFAKFRKWETIRLFFPFPKINVYICNYVKKSLITSGDFHVICETYDHASSLLFGNETVEQKPGVSSTSEPYFALSSDNRRRSSNNYENAPIITLNFLSRRIGNQISFKLIQQFPATAFILMLGQNFNIQTQLHPNENFNYKFTLGSFIDKGSSSLNGGSDEVHIKVEDIYGFATSTEPIWNPLGSWSSDKGLEIMQQSVHGLGNFHGRLLRVTSVEGNPVVYLNRNRVTKEVVGAKGYLPDILDTISAHLNFTYVLIEPVDKSFGSEDTSGSWSGMVGQLQRQEVDIALMSFSLTSGRKEVMDFSPPIEYSAARLLIRRDFQNTELKWNAFLEPFEWKVWLAIPCTIVLGVLLLRCFSYFNVMEVTPVASVCLLVTCFLQKSLDGHSSFQKLPCRIALGSFWVLAVVIYASYTAVLTSFLASTTEKLPLNSLNEAVNNKYWKVGLVQGSSYQDRVKYSSRPELGQFWRRLEQDQTGLVGSFRDGIEKVFNEKYAFFTSDLVPSFMVKGNCSFTWVPGSYFPGFGYIGFPKHFPFAPPISHKVAKIRETGQMKRLFKKWWGENSGCAGIGDGFVGMTLYETGTAFLVLMLGMSLAVFFLSGELFFRATRCFKRNVELEEVNNSNLNELFVGNGNRLKQNTRERREPERLKKQRWCV